MTPPDGMPPAPPPNDALVPPDDGPPLWRDDELEPRFLGIEDRLAAVEQQQTQNARPERTLRAQFTCPFCNTSEERDAPDGPTAWPQVLQGVREEIRMAALLDMPHQRQLAPPPTDVRCEQSVCAGALHGIFLHNQEQLHRDHFSVSLYGWIWELALEEPPRKVHDPKVHDAAQYQKETDARVDSIARKFELRGLGRAEWLIPELEFLMAPAVFCRIDPHSAHRPVHRLLTLAWQREMMNDAFALGEILRRDLDLRGRVPPYESFGRETPEVTNARLEYFAAVVMERMKVLRDKLKRGPVCP